MLEVFERPSPSGSVMVCDDVRQEATGKIIYLGVYLNNEIIFPHETIFPTMLHKLCIQIKYYENKETFPSYEKVEVIFPGEENPIIVETIPPVNIVANAARASSKLPFLGFDAVATISPVTFKEIGEVKIFATNSKSRLRLGSLIVRVVTPDELAAYEALKNWQSTPLAPP